MSQSKCLVKSSHTHTHHKNDHKNRKKVLEYRVWKITLECRLQQKCLLDYIYIDFIFWITKDAKKGLAKFFCNNINDFLLLINFFFKKQIHKTSICQDQDFRLDYQFKWIAYVQMRKLRHGSGCHSTSSLIERLFQNGAQAIILSSSLIILDRGVSTIWIFHPPI